MPTMALISNDEDVRRTLIIKSLPMFPDPIIATLARITDFLSFTRNIIRNNTHSNNDDTPRSLN
jgi:hypothetical protein